jgi:hypothetical protein
VIFFHGHKANKYIDKALIQQYKLQKIPGPDRFDLNDIYCLINSDAMGAGDLTEMDGRVWGDRDNGGIHAPDLAGLCPRERVDTFSRIVSENAIYLFKCGLGRLKKADDHLGQRVYFDTTVLKVTRWITSIMASLLPIASIIVLVHVNSLKTRLWTAGAFNVLISICLTLFTEAKRSEVFAVTAA